MSHNYDPIWESPVRDWDDDVETPWAELDFGEGVYLDHEQLALDEERRKEREIEDYWYQKKMEMEWTKGKWTKDEIFAEEYYLEKEDHWHQKYLIDWADGDP